MRFDKNTLDLLDSIVKNQDYSCSWVIKETAAQYLDYETCFAEQVQERSKAAKSGNVVTHAEAKDRIRALSEEIDWLGPALNGADRFVFLVGESEAGQ